jgi:hypothetical protein
LIVLISLALLFKSSLHSTAQSPASVSAGRTLKMNEEISVPLEVKVRNLQSETWLKDLEIEVKNVSKKPIYNILAYLMFPDETWAEHVGIRLEFGNPILVQLDKVAGKDDPHIDPGETYVLKIDEGFQKGFEKYARESPEKYKRFVLDVEIISFGDGTGLVNGGPRDHRKDISLTTDDKKKARG